MVADTKEAEAEVVDTREGEVAAVETKEVEAEEDTMMAEETDIKAEATREEVVVTMPEEEEVDEVIRVGVEEDEVEDEYKEQVGVEEEGDTVVMQIKFYFILFYTFCYR